MDHHVRLEASLAGKVLPTLDTLERFFVSMGPLVSGQRLTAAHLEPTHGTLVRKRFVVARLMPGESDFVVEAFEANRAFDGFVLVVQRLFDLVDLVGGVGVSY